MARILVVDDDPVVQELVRELLYLQRHVVDLADDGAQALEKLRQSSYDLVIMDRKMPVMNGIEAISAIRGDARLRGLKVLMFTSARGPDIGAEALAAGADGCLYKPVLLEEFADTISRTLERT